MALCLEVALGHVGLSFWPHSSHSGAPFSPVHCTQQNRLLHCRDQWQLLNAVPELAVPEKMRKILIAASV